MSNLGLSPDHKHCSCGAGKFIGKGDPVDGIDKTLTKLRNVNYPLGHFTTRPCVRTRHPMWAWAISLKPH